MKKLILITTLLLAFACSKDDEGETFLDKYNGTSWSLETEKMYSGDLIVIKEIFTFSSLEHQKVWFSLRNINIVKSGLLKSTVFPKKY